MATKINDLSKSAESELGGNDLSFVIAVDRKGGTRLFKPDRVKANELSASDFPIDSTKINNISSNSIVAFEVNPNCIVWEGIIGGQWVRYVFCF